MAKNNSKGTLRLGIPSIHVLDNPCCKRTWVYNHYSKSCKLFPTNIANYYIYSHGQVLSSIDLPEFDLENKSRILVSQGRKGSSLTWFLSFSQKKTVFSLYFLRGSMQKRDAFFCLYYCLFTIQKMYSRMFSTSCCTMYHVIATVEDNEMVWNWISQEQNMTFSWNKRIFKLYLKEYFYRHYFK